MTTQQLNQARIKALSIYNDLRHEREEKERRLLQVERERISREMDIEYEERTKAAHIAASLAADAHTEAVERDALTGDGCAVPLGSRVCEWTQPRSYFTDKTKRPTGVTGVVEAVTRQAMFPANQSNPGVGEFIIRLNKKDGKPSLKFVKFPWRLFSEGKTLPYGWHLEGVDPNKAAK